jgi:hypothetical protein
VFRQTGLILLIVSIAAVVQSDDEALPPRRIDPSANAAPLQPKETEDRGDDRTHARAIDPVTQQPFSYTDKATTPAPAGRPPEAVELFHCDFGAQWDTNFDNWPDRWVREHSVDYPHYLPIRIVDDASPVANRSIRADLNGG